jgi:hypothetical protein
MDQRPVRADPNRPREVEGKANRDASNAGTFVQPNRKKWLVVRRVGWTTCDRLGTIGGLARFDRLGGAPYR